MTVVYDPSNPRYAHCASFAYLWGMPIGFIIGGLISIVIAILTFAGLMVEEG